MYLIPIYVISHIYLSIYLSVFIYLSICIYIFSVHLISIYSFFGVPFHTHLYVLYVEQKDMSRPPGRLRMESDYSVTDELSSIPPGRMRSVSETTRSIVKSTFRENWPSGKVRSRGEKEILESRQGPPGEVRKPSSASRKYMIGTDVQSPVEHPEMFQDKNLPPGIPFSSRAEKAIERWAQSSGTRVDEIKKHARQRPDGSLDMSDPESDFTDLPPLPLIYSISEGKRERVSYEEEEEVKLLQETLPSNATDLFNEFDVDGDGFINASELREALRKRGMINESISAEKMISVADSDSNDRLDLKEFQRILSIHGESGSTTTTDSIVSTPSQRYEMSKRRFSVASTRSAVSLENPPSRHNSISAVIEDVPTIVRPGSRTSFVEKEKRIQKTTSMLKSSIQSTRFAQDVNRETSAILGEVALEKCTTNRISSTKLFVRETRPFFYIVKNMRDRASISQACRVLRGYYQRFVTDRETQIALTPFWNWVGEFEAEYGVI